MGDIDRRGLETALQLADFHAHGDAQLGVEIRQRLVEQKYLRLAHNGTSHGDALALTAGQLPRLALQHRRDFENLRGLAHPRIDLRFRRAAIAQAVGHVVVDAHMRIERVVLEDHGDVAIRRFDLVDDASANVDFAAGDGFKTSHHAQQRGLSAAAWPDQHAELSVSDFEVDALDGFHAAGIGLLHIAQDDIRHARSLKLPAATFLFQQDRARTAAA